MPRCLHWRVPLAITSGTKETDGSIGAAELGCSLGQEHINDPLAGTHRDRTYYEPVPLFFKSWNIFYSYSYFLFSLFSPTSQEHRETFMAPSLQPQGLNAANFLAVPMIPSPGSRRHGEGRQGKVPAVGRYQTLTYAIPLGLLNPLEGSYCCLGRQATSLHHAASKDQALINSGLGGLASTTHNFSAEVTASVSYKICMKNPL